MLGTVVALSSCHQQRSSGNSEPLVIFGVQALDLGSRQVQSERASVGVRLQETNTVS